MSIVHIQIVLFTFVEHGLEAHHQNHRLDQLDQTASQVPSQTHRTAQNRYHQVHSDRSQVETKKSYDLKNGMCTVNETIEADAEALFDPISGQYEDKKIRLIIQMASTNGVIPAGSVSFNPSNKEYFEKVEYTLPLEKCPDRSAQINFFQSFQLLRKEGSGNQQSSIRAGTNILKSEVRYSSSNTNLM